MEQKTKTDAKAAFVGIGSYPVRLTYLFTEPKTSILFKCKMLLEADDVAARQAYYALPEGDMPAAQFAYEVDMLCRIVTDVEGLPGFEFDGQRESVDGDKRRPQTLADALKEYFETGEPLLRKIASEAVTMYNKVTQPQEFFL